MDSFKFTSVVAKTDFANRYYSLCSDFLSCDSTCKAPTKEIRRILTDLERHPDCWHSSARAYEFETTSNSLVLSVGFRIHGGTDVDFDFCAESRDGTRAGGPFAVIAGGVTQLIGAPAHDPPYPMPLFTSLDDLSTILAECFRLGDILLSSCTFNPDEPVV